MANVMTVFVTLVKAYLRSESILEPKNPDYIYCIDKRDENNPKTRVFNLMMDQILTLGKPDLFPDHMAEPLNCEHEMEVIKRQVSDPKLEELMKDEERNKWNEWVAKKKE